MKLLILDEADHILDIGYRACIEDILRYLPRLRQTLLFSATMPKEVFWLELFEQLCGYHCRTNWNIFGVNNSLCDFLHRSGA